MFVFIYEICIIIFLLIQNRPVARFWVSGILKESHMESEKPRCFVSFL